MAQSQTNNDSAPPRSWRVRLHAAALDERLTAGADSDNEPELALRAWQLSDPRLRAKVADSISVILVRARLGPRPSALGAPTELATEAVLASGADLRVLVTCLRAAEAVDARGVAMTKRLIRDRCGPLFNAAAVEPLSYCVRMATLCLEPGRDRAACTARRRQPPHPPEGEGGRVRAAGGALFRVLTQPR